MGLLFLALLPGCVGEAGPKHSEVWLRLLWGWCPWLVGPRGTLLMVRLLFQVAHGALSDGALDAVETQKELLGASGLMLLLAPKVKSEDVAEEDVYWLSALLQLKQLLQAKPFQPALPLVVLVPSSGGDAMEKDVEDGS